jgi:hypothetical protein
LPTAAAHTFVASGTATAAGHCRDRILVITFVRKHFSGLAGQILDIFFRTFLNKHPNDRRMTFTCCDV